MTESPGPNRSDEDAVADLHHELADQLKRLAWAMLHDWALAEDAVQEAFLLLAAKASEIPTQQQRGWLVKTVQYSALNFRRKRERAGKLLREQAENYISTSNHSDQANALDDELLKLKDALNELPDEQRLVIRQRIYESKTFQQIATESGLPLGTVLSRMRLGLERLRSKLK